ncbi:MAG TPA: bifunctional tetrahydrofolate synthase/dihydrofolate synthase [Gammaproteobacteria bacterium]
MRHKTLDAWLAWQETLNPRGIELGLDRVRRVLAALDLENPPYRVLTIAGTNGKGSVASFAASILQSAGMRTGRYLSPHLLKYNERVAIDGVEADDAQLCAAFDIVDRARGDEPLTYFEFGTLAALEIFRQREVAVAVLEVGLGGRLDAVNAIDADVAAVVSVGLDHVDWLGSEIDGIAREKAGIFRFGRPAIFGSRNLPKAIASEAERIGAPLAAFGHDFHCERRDGTWSWRAPRRMIDDLPPPPLTGAHQFANASTAIAAVLALEPSLPADTVRAGVAATHLAGRLQSLSLPGAREIIVDVGHNPDAAAHIAEYLLANPKPTVAVLAMLADKDAPGFVRELVPLVDDWHLATLEGSRGQDAESLERRFRDAGLELATRRHASVAEAAEAAIAQSLPGERVLVLGSFHTVAAFLLYFEALGGKPPGPHT